jgi:hypothetical protein
LAAAGRNHLRQGNFRIIVDGNFRIIVDGNFDLS